MTRERRRYFRIDDIVGLKTDVVEARQIKQRLDQFWNDKHDFSIRNDFNFQLDQHLADLKTISTKMPELGRYLSVLQEQLDILTERVLNEQDDFIAEETQVSISAQGISFNSNEPVTNGEIVELHIKLLPTQQKIIVFAKVVSCSRTDIKGEFNIALDFEHIHESDRELLVKHVHGKQLKALGATRFEEDI